MEKYAVEFKRWLASDKLTDAERAELLSIENTDRVLLNGVVGKVGGLQVAISDKLTASEGYIVAAGALGLEYKRRVQVETDRDIVAKTTVMTGDVHYATYLRDESKAIKLTIGT